MESPIVHCIHDPLRTDRLALLQKEIATQGMNVRYWPAIKDPVMGFRGISRAHKQIVRWAALEGLPEVLIMEDDCYFFAPGAFQFFLSQKPDKYDLYLGNVFSGLEDGSRTRDFRGMTLYFCSSRFYREFLGLPEENHIDGALAGRGEYFVCAPMVCSQTGGYSDNKKAQVDSYDHYLANYNLFGRNK